jgi:TRAP-type C4-dicarboxylate transport system permease small subunit
MSTPSPEPEEPGDLAARVAAAGRRQELLDPDLGLPRADVIVNRVAEALGVVLLAAVVLIVFVNAAMRYVLDTSIIWAEEVVLGLIPWLAMVGLFLAIRRRTMIRIDYFFNRFSAPLRRALAVLGQSWSAVAFAYLAWVSIGYLNLFGGDRTPYLGVPKGIFAAALVVGGVAAVAAFALEAWRAGGRVGERPGKSP